jgi:hypothetical protein
MKPHLLDRLLTIFLCSGLVLSLWSLAMAYPALSQTAPTVF